MSRDNVNGEITFDIIEHIGVLATYTTGWKKEINLVSWNNAPGKYDIREWDPSHGRMSRGITLKEDEMRRILDLMKRRRSRARNRVRSVPDDVARDIAVEAASNKSHTAEHASAPMDSLESEPSGETLPAADAADIANESEN